MNKREERDLPSVGEGPGMAQLGSHHSAPPNIIVVDRACARSLVSHDLFYSSLFVSHSP